MVWRGFGRLLAAAALGCLIVLLVTSAEATVEPAPATGGSPPSSLQAAGAPGVVQQDGRQGASQTECEQRLQSDRRPGVPAVVIVGASITAGVGAEDPAGSWAVLLARQLRWNAFVYGVPGAGYVHTGLGRKGPAAAEIARADLRALRPSLVIVQAGHDDWRVPPDLERLRVEQTVATIKAEAPQARIALLTVFAGRSRPRAIYQTDQAIVAGAGAADPQVIIMDPLTSGWRFQSRGTPVTHRPVQEQRRGRPRQRGDGQAGQQERGQHHQHVPEDLAHPPITSRSGVRRQSIFRR